MKGWPGEPDMTYDVMVAEGDAASAEGDPVRDVIFDFGNVLLYWDPAAALVPRYSPAHIERFLDNDISGFYDANDRMDAGMTRDEGVAWMRRTHGDEWADMMRYYLDNFEDSLTGPVPGARMLVHDLKAAGLGVWGLSNWEHDLFAVAQDQCPLIGELDGTVVSGFVRLRKPDRAIYERALHDFRIAADTAVFIDDKAMNVIGANRAGIRAIRFRDPTRLRARLIDAGVPIPAVR